MVLRLLVLVNNITIDLIRYLIYSIALPNDQLFSHSFALRNRHGSVAEQTKGQGSFQGSAALGPRHHYKSPELPLAFAAVARHIKPRSCFSHSRRHHSITLTQVPFATKPTPSPKSVGRNLLLLAISCDKLLSLLGRHGTRHHDPPT
jgi:hypothetical protein